jgi:hypothetical protein
MNHTIRTQNFELLLPLQCPTALSKVEEGYKLHPLLSNNKKKTKQINKIDQKEKHVAVTS